MTRVDYGQCRSCKCELTAGNISGVPGTINGVPVVVKKLKCIRCDLLDNEIPIIQLLHTSGVGEWHGYEFGCSDRLTVLKPVIGNGNNNRKRGRDRFRSELPVRKVT